MSKFNFMDLARAEYARQAKQKVKKPVAKVQMSSAAKVARKRQKADAARERERQAPQRAAGVMGAVGNFAKAVAAGLEAEGERRRDLGLSGAGFAAAFSSGIEGLTDYTDMLQGNAAPGTVLFDAAMSNIQNKNQAIETDSSGQPKGVDALETTEEEEEGEFPDLLSRPVETEKGPIKPNTIMQAVQEGLERGVEQTGPARPVLLDNPGYTMNMMASIKRYSPQTFDQVVAMTSNFGPGAVGPFDQGYTKPVSPLFAPGVTTSITEEEAMQRRQKSRTDPNSLPEAMQPTGVGDTSYRSLGQASGAGLAPMPGTPFTPGQSVGGRAVPAR